MAWTSNFYFQFGNTSLEYLNHGSVSRSWVQGQGHRSKKAVACNSKTTDWKLPGLDQNICNDNARSNSELLTFLPWPLTLRHIVVFSSFECLTLAVSFSVWRYILEYLGHLWVSRLWVSPKVTVTRQQQCADMLSMCSPRTQFNYLRPTFVVCLVSKLTYSNVTATNYHTYWLH